MKIWLISCVAAMTVACGHHGNGDGTDGGGGGDSGTISDGGGTIIDGGGTIIDAPPASGACTSTGPQCSNCIDDDGDGRIDGFDPECTGATDNDEATFATGIPGDNMDAINQDCFFDGDSGAGNDGCNIHVCCLLGAKTELECDNLLGNKNVKYDPNTCPPPLGTGVISQMCIDVCGKLAPPGCDCFGCCTICDPVTNVCADIEVNPAVSPNCTPDTITDPTKCLACTKNTQCTSGDCGGVTCVLCPGQDPSDLPASCTSTVCPSGQQTCSDTMTCPDGTYCSAGCCIGVIL